MTSNPPSQCCIVGARHEGAAKGEMRMIGDVEAYFTFPEGNRNPEYGILVLPDIIGHAFINAQLIADQFAANDYLICMPDQFHGDALPLNRSPDFDLQGWLKNHMPNEVDPIVEACLQEMKKLGCKKIAGVGYCFGAKYVVRYLRPGDIDVGYMAHPTFVEAEELGGIKGPLSIAAAVVDGRYPIDKRNDSERILDEVGQPWQQMVYGGVKHGWATRGDVKQKQVRIAKEQAFLQAVQWFDAFLKE